MHYAARRHLAPSQAICARRRGRHYSDASSIEGRAQKQFSGRQVVLAMSRAMPDLVAEDRIGVGQVSAAVCLRALFESLLLGSAGLRGNEMRIHGTAERYRACAGRWMAVHCTGWRRANCRRHSDRLNSPAVRRFAAFRDAGG